jgi:DNA-binding LytR/AlgR family response regulator
MNADIKVLIADDEPELVRELDRQLRLAWPELTAILHAANGTEALQRLEQEQPQVAFLDIRMPGSSGLEVAQQLRHPCHIVFVTAYDQYAVDAFEREAVDYLLKPVREDRLLQTVQRLRQRLETTPRGTTPNATDVAALLDKVTQLLKPAAAPPLQWLQASIGERIQLIATAEVLYLRSEDKYTIVHTAAGQYPIRTPLKDLEHRLDVDHFWRIHRNCIVNARYVRSLDRDFRGRLSLSLQGSADTLVVSRRYADRFRPL